MAPPWNIDPVFRLWGRVAWAVRRRGAAGAARALWRTVSRALGFPERAGDQDADARYDRWVRERERRARATSPGRAGDARGAARPRVSLLCVLPGAAAAAARLGATVASLAEQREHDWELVVVPGDEGAARAAASLAGPRVRALARSGGDDRAALDVALAAARGATVAVVEPGDALAPAATLDVAQAFEDARVDLVYSDEDVLGPGGGRTAPRFKPDWSPDLLLSTPYLGRLCAFRTTAARVAGGFRPGPDGAEEHDLALRVVERGGAAVHVARVLYHAAARRAPDAAAARRAVAAALARRGVAASVEDVGPGRFRVRYAVPGTPRVSVVIPTRDRLDLLRPCVESILGGSTYPDVELVVVDNGSTDPETLAYLRALPAPHRVLSWPGAFNWSAINNFAARTASGEVLVFANNDVEVVTPGWIEAMLEHASRSEVGAVGAKLLYPDGTIQHAGVVLGIRGLAGHAFRLMPADAQACGGLATVVRDVSAVTGACLMVRRAAFEEVGGFDERLAISFNDVDFCLRLRERGRLIVQTPFAVLTHRESATRKAVHPWQESLYIRRRWGALFARGDPYYNPNLTLDREDFSVDVG